MCQQDELPRLEALLASLLNLMSNCHPEDREELSPLIVRQLRLISIHPEMADAGLLKTVVSRLAEHWDAKKFSRAEARSMVH